MKPDHHPDHHDYLIQHIKSLMHSFNESLGEAADKGLNLVVTILPANDGDYEHTTFSQLRITQIIDLA